jgi:hypothetical protein
MPVDDEFFRPDGQQRDAVLVGFDFPWHSDDHSSVLAGMRIVRLIVGRLRSGIKLGVESCGARAESIRAAAPQPVPGSDFRIDSC